MDSIVDILPHNPEIMRILRIPFTDLPMFPVETSRLYISEGGVNFFSVVINSYRAKSSLGTFVECKLDGIVKFDHSKRRIARLFDTFDHFVVFKKTVDFSKC